MEVEDDGLRLSESVGYDSVESEEVQSEDEELEVEPEDTLVSGSNAKQNCLHFRGKRYEDLHYGDLIDVEFADVKEVDTFYSFYALAMGFSIRKQKLDKNAEGVVVRRQLVCKREGVRKKKNSNNPLSAHESLRFGGMSPERNIHAHGMQAEKVGDKSVNKRRRPHTRRETRKNCEARITVRRCLETGKFRTIEFITEHNHELVPTEMKSFLLSHRKVGDHAMAQVNALRKVSVRTCRAYELLVHQAGGHEFVGFTIKDLYNKVDGERRELCIDGDGQAAIGFMNCKASKDPDFYCLFSVDEKGRLCNLFWRDSKSMIDYDNFGDVLIFDSTYKTNIYDKPLAVFVGVNNHRATVLFGCALLNDETEDTYVWVVSAFLASMKGKRPMTVITDGDGAMRLAVNRVMPQARHRLCAWHIANNVTKNVGKKEVQSDFIHLIYAGLSVTDWESSWHYMVAIHGLQGHRWIDWMYSIKERWAEAFFRDQFCAGVCSTQRCEGMHRNLKTGAGKYKKLCEFLPRMDKTSERMRYNQLYDDFKSMSSEPVIGNHMRCIQEQIATKFTHDIFLLIKDQILFESKFVVADQVEYENAASTCFVVTQYGKPERTWHVTHLHSSPSISFKCSCQLFESDGIPCCHIFTVMKAKLITNFPESLVTKRWTKEATPKKTNMISRSCNIPEVDLQLARYGQMMCDLSRICHLASLSDEAYEETCEAFSRLMIRSQKWSGVEHSRTVPDVGGLHPNVIRDPELCRTKGNQTRSTNVPNEGEQPSGRACGFCSRPGHNIRTCLLYKNALNDGSIDQQGGSHHAGQFIMSELNQGGQSSLFAYQPSSQSISVPTSAAGFPNLASGLQLTRQVDEDTVFLAQTSSQHMIHHVEEARTFDFFSGHHNILSSVLGENGNQNQRESCSINQNQNDNDTWPYRS